MCCTGHVAMGLLQAALLYVLCMLLAQASQEFYAAACTGIIGVLRCCVHPACTGIIRILRCCVQLPGIIGFRAADEMLQLPAMHCIAISECSVLARAAADQ